MFIKMKFEVYVEITIRLALWGVFLHLNHADPFIRHIEPNEHWLYNYPDVKSYIPSADLWWIIVGFPFMLLLTEYVVGKDVQDVCNAIWGLTLGYGLNGAISTLIKVLVGRPRPSFFHRCFPDGVGQDLNKCTGPLRGVMDGRKSFPSAHASFSFTCMVFLSLYIARKLHLMETRKSWKLCICIVPILAATCISISRTCDYHHHYEDVFVGAVLGTIIAWLVYRLYFGGAVSRETATSDL